MKIVNWSQLSIAEQRSILQRPVSQNQHQKGVSEIIRRVRQEGDAALYDLTQSLDKVRLESLTVEINQATIASINTAEKTAIQLAFDQISAFHQACLPEPLIFKQAGLSLSRRYRPIPRVGLYIPGGRNT